MRDQMPLRHKVEIILLAVTLLPVFRNLRRLHEIDVSHFPSHFTEASAIVSIISVTWQFVIYHLHRSRPGDFVHGQLSHWHLCHERPSTVFSKDKHDFGITCIDFTRGKIIFNPTQSIQCRMCLYFIFHFRFNIKFVISNNYNRNYYNRSLAILHFYIKFTRLIFNLRFLTNYAIMNNYTALQKFWILFASGSV